MPTSGSTSSRRRREPGANRRPTRAARDLAAFVSAFGAGEAGRELSASALNNQLLGMLDRFAKSDDLAELQPDDINECRFALVAWIDEVIHRSNWPGRAEWAAEPLQKRLYRTSRAGNVFYEHLQRLRPDQLRVREIYLLVLTLGFEGQYSDQPAERRALIAHQYDTLRAARLVLEADPRAVARAGRLRGSSRPAPRGGVSSCAPWLASRSGWCSSTARVGSRCSSSRRWCRCRGGCERAGEDLQQGLGARARGGRRGRGSARLSDPQLVHGRDHRPVHPAGGAAGPDRAALRAARARGGPRRGAREGGGGGAPRAVAGRPVADRGAAGEVPRAVDGIKKDFRAARRSHELPWVLFIGDEDAGKSTLLAGAGSTCLRSTRAAASAPPTLQGSCARTS